MSDSSVNRVAGQTQKSPKKKGPARSESPIENGRISRLTNDLRSKFNFVEQYYRIIYLLNPNLKQVSSTIKEVWGRNIKRSD